MYVWKWVISKVAYSSKPFKRSKLTGVNSSSISYGNFIPGLGPGERFVEASSIS